MNEIISLVITNLEQVGFGALLFLLAYISNMGLGAYRNVKIDGGNFDWKLIGNSIVKFIVLGLSLAILSVTVSVLPQFATYIGLTIDAETLSTIDGIVIIGSFMTATIRYVVDSISKIKNILGLGE